jgi:site-specific recombinase XerC
MDVLVADPEVDKERVGKEPFPHLPFPFIPPQFSPMAAYLSRLAPSSRLTMGKLLRCPVKLPGASMRAGTFPWPRLDYSRTLRLPQILASRYTPAPANPAFSALRGVLREAWRLGQMSYQNFRRATDLARVRGDRHRPRKSVDTGRIERLLAATYSDETVRGRRDFAILSVLCGAGMLRAELTHLDLSHVEGAQLMVIGKGSKWRQAHLGLEAVAALASWLAVRRSAPGALFLPSHRSGSLRPGRLSIEAVARVISRRTVVAGVGMLRPHDLRGALATRLLKTGVDVLLVQRILGYRSVATTQIYDCRIDSAAHTAAIQ